MRRRAEDPESAARIDALGRGLFERSGAKSWIHVPTFSDVIVAAGILPAIIAPSF
jgi:hypothetical protein